MPPVGTWTIAPHFPGSVARAPGPRFRWTSKLIVISHYIQCKRTYQMRRPAARIHAARRKMFPPQFRFQGRARSCLSSPPVGCQSATLHSVGYRILLMVYPISYRWDVRWLSGSMIRYPVGEHDTKVILQHWQFRGTSSLTKVKLIVLRKTWFTLAGNNKHSAKMSKH